MGMAVSSPGRTPRTTSAWRLRGFVLKLHHGQNLALWAVDRGRPRLVRFGSAEVAQVLLDRSHDGVQQNIPAELDDQVQHDLLTAALLETDIGGRLVAVRFQGSAQRLVLVFVHRLVARTGGLNQDGGHDDGILTGHPKSRRRGEPDERPRSTDPKT